MKILFFSWGDPGKKSTWSNVPYCFSKALENNGNDVVKINLDIYPKLTYIWNRFFLRIINKFFKNPQYDFFRTVTLYKLVSHHIKRRLKENPDADLCIFTTFSFYNNYNNIPSLLFCDWSYETYLERIGHKPYFFEKCFIKRERKVLTNAHAVVSLFPECSIRINKQLGSKTVKWAGVSAPNILDSEKFDSEQILETKISNNSILFIGDYKYYKGAKLLISAFNKIKSEIPNLELHIIGMQIERFQDINDLSKIYFHGYLSKDKDHQCKKYYNLLRKSSLFCNPSETWGGFSSTVEALYFYTPIIISPYEDFVTQFGENIEFGTYNKKFDEETLTINIVRFFELSKQQRLDMCKKAHQSVENLHWNEYAKRILSYI